MFTFKFIKRCFTYTQGQLSGKNVREYFYFIDHQGMRKNSWNFFFKRLRPNVTGRYEKDFPFISPCGRELNFIRCDDMPIVYTHIVNKNNKDVLCYGHIGDIMYQDFQPDHIYMDNTTGRVYHPAPETAGSIGLIRSKLAIEISSNLRFYDGEDKSPTHFLWKDKEFVLNNEWFKKRK
uniref:Uncharacterized protein n=1 Tax=Clastoptera arizonana TaxID=38151 RepID=A0A1B6E3I0_9HEMI